jgi:hypothetical protein
MPLLIEASSEIFLFGYYQQQSIMALRLQVTLRQKMFFRI